MIPATLSELWRRRLAEQDSVEEEHDTLSADHHDLILRYALLGIFVIMFIAALSVAQAIVMPVVAGMILGFVLGPLVDRMVRFGLPQGLAAAILVGFGVVVMLLMIGIFTAPFAIWSDRLPGILSALRYRMSDIIAFARQFEGLAGSLNQGSAPEVKVADSTPLINIALSSTTAAGGLLVLIATIYFYLATRRHLKARVLRLCLGASARRSAGAFFEGVESKIATYFGVVTLINLGMGLITTLVAWGAGLPFPVFWGLVAAVLNYIAFIGPVIMTVLLFGAGLLDDGATLRAAWPALVYFAAHLIEGNIVTPMLVGRRLTLSPFLVFISFVFWLWLWGPVGAILSTPLLLVITLTAEAIRDYQRMEAEHAQPAAAAEAEPAGGQADDGVAREAPALVTNVAAV